MFDNDISMLIRQISTYPYCYIVTFDDEGNIKSFDKKIDERFREMYDRDMNTLQQLILFERIANYGVCLDRNHFDPAEYRC